MPSRDQSAPCVLVRLICTTPLWGRSVTIFICSLNLFKMYNINIVPVRNLEVNMLFIHVRGDRNDEEELKQWWDHAGVRTGYPSWLGHQPRHPAGSSQLLPFSPQVSVFFRLTLHSLCHVRCRSHCDPSQSHLETFHVMPSLKHLLFDPELQFPVV